MSWIQYISQFPISNPSAKMLVDLSHFGVLKVSGTDAAKFLQGQLTCDVIALKPGDSTLGAYCNIKGKVTSLFRLWRLNDDYYLRMLDGLVEQTLQELQKYAIFSKVELQNVSATIHGFGVANHIVNMDLADPHLAIIEVAPQQRYEVFGPVKSLERAWQHCIAHANHVDPALWETLDIKDKLPELYPATVDHFFPHDLNLPELGAVSFTKGCYRGQEIVARMQHRGNLKRQLRSFHANGVSHFINPGDLITAGGPELETVAGTVVRACRVLGDQVLGLAVISESYVQAKLSCGAAAVALQ